MTGFCCTKRASSEGNRFHLRILDSRCRSNLRVLNVKKLTWICLFVEKRYCLICLLCRLLMVRKRFWAAENLFKIEKIVMWHNWFSNFIEYYFKLCSSWFWNYAKLKEKYVLTKWHNSLVVRRFYLFEACAFRVNNQFLSISSLFLSWSDGCLLYDYVYWH